MILGRPEDTTVMFWDSGLFTHIAESLAPHFKKFYYYSEWRDPFPYFYKRYVGDGLPGIQRVANPWLHIPDCDLVIFPDVGYGGETEFLRVHYGKLVWSTGLGEILELDRKELLRTQEDLGIATPEYTIIKGVDNLREFLKKHDDVYVKINTFRGDRETFHNDTYSVSRPLLDEFLNRVSGIQEIVEFIVQYPLPGVEIGYDGSCINGQYSQVALWGIEGKDKAYCSQVCDYKDLPESLQYINEVFSPIYDELGVRGFMSNEVRQNSAKQFVLIDPCMRAGVPPSEAYTRLFKNWPDHILAGAQGEVVDFEPDGEYAVEIMLNSEFVARNRWMAVYFPEEYRDRICLHGHTIQGGVDYCVNLDPESPGFGAAVGIGPTLDKAIADALEVASSIQAPQLDFSGTAVQEIKKEIAELGKHGIEWSR